MKLKGIGAFCATSTPWPTGNATSVSTAISTSPCRVHGRQQATASTTNPPCSATPYTTRFVKTTTPRVEKPMCRSRAATNSIHASTAAIAAAAGRLAARWGRPDLPNNNNDAASATAVRNRARCAKRSGWSIQSRPRVVESSSTTVHAAPGHVSKAEPTPHSTPAHHATHQTAAASAASPAGGA